MINRFLRQWCGEFFWGISDESSGRSQVRGGLQRKDPCQVGQYGCRYRHRRGDAIKRKRRNAEVIAVSCGVSHCQETLRTTMVIGADRAILVTTTAELQQPLVVGHTVQRPG